MRPPWWNHRREQLQLPWQACASQSPSRSEKALFYLHIQELVGLVCFFGTINKRSNFFLLCLLVYLSERLFLLTVSSSTQADLAKWTYECMHPDRILLPKWNVGICYAPQVEK